MPYIRNLRNSMAADAIYPSARDLKYGKMLPNLMWLLRGIVPVAKRTIYARDA